MTKRILPDGKVMVQVSFLLEEKVATQMDRARGRMPKSEWIRNAIQKELDDTPLEVARVPPLKRHSVAATYAGPLCEVCKEQPALDGMKICFDCPNPTPET